MDVVHIIGLRPPNGDPKPRVPSRRERCEGCRAEILVSEAPLRDARVGQPKEVHYWCMACGIRRAHGSGQEARIGAETRQEARRAGVSDAAITDAQTVLGEIAGCLPRAEHLAWAKERALEYVDRGDMNGAFASMASDLGKHPELARHAGLALGVMLLIAGHLESPAQMREFIEGFR